MSTEGKRAVVIGGGVIGAACAYFLARDGWQVTIIDQGEFGRGCSHGNCGYVCPSHVLPLAAPGAVRGALKALLSPQLAIHDPAALRPGALELAVAFRPALQQPTCSRPAHAIQALLNSSRALYAEILEREHMDCEWENRGLLFVFQTPAAMDHYEETDHLLRDTSRCPPSASIPRRSPPWSRH